MPMNSWNASHYMDKTFDMNRLNLTLMTTMFGLLTDEQFSSPTVTAICLQTWIAPFRLSAFPPPPVLAPQVENKLRESAFEDLYLSLFVPQAKGATAFADACIA